MKIGEHKPLRDLTTMKIGGTARYFAEVASVEELREAAAFAGEKRIPLIVLGGGSNVLITDGELDALVVKMEIKGVDYNSLTNSVSQTVVTAGAGEDWDALVAQAVERGLWGTENLSGIPGTVGAAPVQNIGAYGAELKDVLDWVEVLNTADYNSQAIVHTSLTVVRLSNADCRFGYRDSIFKHKDGKNLIITRVALRLTKNGRPNLEYKDLKESFNFQFSIFNEKEKQAKIKELTPTDIRRAVLEIRSRKFPNLNEFGTAGSFFKNPVIPTAQYDELKKKYPDLVGYQLLTTNHQQPMVKVPLAWILDNICHMKGLTQGNVGLYKKQPIVLVNLGGATAEDAKRLADGVIACVKEKTGIRVEYEVQMIK